MQAIDVTMLDTHLREFTRSWEFSGEIPNANEFQQLRSEYNQLRRQLPTVVANLVSEASQWTTEITSWFGEDFEKDALVESLRDLLSTARAQQFPPDRIKSLRALVDRFRETPLKETIKDVNRLKDDRLSWTTLAVLGRLDVGTMKFTGDMVREFEEFFDEVRGHLVAERTRVGAGVVERARHQVLAELEAIDDLVISLIGDPE